MTIETFPFDAAEFLQTPEAQAELITDALESGDAGYVAHALRIVARARGLGDLATNAELGGAEDSAPGDPRLSSLMMVMKALGMRLNASAA